MAKLRIRTYGDPVLRQKSAPVRTVDAELRRLARAMGEAMYEHRGVGLAAPQVGIHKRLIVVDVEWVKKEGDGEKSETGKRNLRVYVNPEVTWESAEDDSMSEGCLSVPGVEGEVYRPRKIRLKHLSLAGLSHEEEMDGMLARCIQHEIDHLDGVLFVDRMPFLKRARIAGALNRLKKDTLAGAAPAAKSAAAL
ncbi:MAG: peptide deformylase [Candidatus Sumerlaeota bacterium]|nr:peptide deformylase [Candidatus Sumerlaeota bacterium]